MKPRTGIRKAAVLLVSLRQDAAAQVFARLDPETMEAVSLEIARLRDVSPEERRSVLEEFRQMSLAQEYLEQGGLEYARTLLERSLPKAQAQQMAERVRQAVESAPFRFLRKTGSEEILSFVHDEHPQTIALILAHLPPEKAAEVVRGLEPRARQEVIRRIATMERIHPDVLREVEKTLEDRVALAGPQGTEPAGGVEAAAQILNRADRATEREVLESLEGEVPGLVEKIRHAMFAFDGLLQVPDRGIQRVLKEIAPQELALALKAAGPEVREKIFRNVSQRAAQMIHEEMEYLGPVRMADVESAQQRIVEVVRRLEEAGEVVIEGREGPEQIVL